MEDGNPSLLRASSYFTQVKTRREIDLTFQVSLPQNAKIKSVNIEKINLRVTLVQNPVHSFQG
jgi:hypothetical protein